MPISSCRCGLPSSNASQVLAPAEVVRLDCRDWYGCPPADWQGTGTFGREAWGRRGRAVGIAGERGLCSL